MRRQAACLGESKHSRFSLIPGELDFRAFFGYFHLGFMIKPSFLSCLVTICPCGNNTSELI